MTLPSSRNDPETGLDDEILLKNSLDDLEILSDRIAALALKYGFSQKLTFELDLVLAEAVTNVIQNAYADAEEHQIIVRLQGGSSTVKVEIRDDGMPFDPLQYPEVNFPTSLAEAEEGGLGIHLIRSYSRECAYQRQGNENVLTLVLGESGAS